ncbi:uncharacterized protein [Gossypium hirsutum]|uniref:Yippee domain-containing protein n=1 Tax=Gossypium hirsutum TaxID=3635 RepID=A0ABM2ZUF6_GOSHI|nr:uncharacterized protein LOC121215558 [Gossypium hirsutum]
MKPFPFLLQRTLKFISENYNWEIATFKNPLCCFLLHFRIPLRSGLYKITMGVTWTQLKSFLKVLVSWIPMATPPNTVRYKMNSGNRFFICRNCRNHLVTWNNCRGRVKKREARGFLCHDAVNVRTDPISTHRFLFNLPVVKVRCNRCNMRLGQQFFTLDSLRPLPNLMERSFLLQLDRLRYWDGTKLIVAPHDDRLLNLSAQSSLTKRFLLLLLVSFFLFGFVLYWVR